MISLLKNPKAPVIAGGITLYALGVLSGWFFAGQHQTKSPLSPEGTKTSQRSSNSSSPVATSSAAERLSRPYNSAKDRVTRDEKAKKISTRQATLLRAKIEELYKSKSGTIAGNDEDTNTAKQRSQSRQALRQWLKANNLSIVYFAGLY